MRSCCGYLDSKFSRQGKAKHAQLPAVALSLSLPTKGPAPALPWLGPAPHHSQSRHRLSPTPPHHNPSTACFKTPGAHLWQLGEVLGGRPALPLPGRREVEPVLVLLHLLTLGPPLPILPACRRLPARLCCRDPLRLAAAPAPLPGPALLALLVIPLELLLPERQLRQLGRQRLLWLACWWLRPGVLPLAGGRPAALQVLQGASMQLVVLLPKP